MGNLSEVDLLLKNHLVEYFPGLPLSPEYRFAPDRRWRFDWAIVARKLAIEIEGGIWTRGRHTRGAGYQGDLDKYNSATSLGWRVYRFSVNDILSGKDLIFLKAEASSTEIRISEAQ